MDVLCEPTAFLTLNKRLFSRNDWVRHTCHCFTNHYIVRVPHKSQVLVYAQDCQISYCELVDLLLKRFSAAGDLLHRIWLRTVVDTPHAPVHALINVTLMHIIYDVAFSDISWSSPFCILRVFTSKCWIISSIWRPTVYRGNPVIHMPCRSFCVMISPSLGFAINQSVYAHKLSNVELIE